MNKNTFFFFTRTVLHHLCVEITTNQHKTLEVKPCLFLIFEAACTAEIQTVQ